MTDRCGEYEAAIQRLFDGDLPEEERRGLEGHAAGCATCREEMAAWSALFAGLDAMPLDEPAIDFNASVLRRIAVPVPEPARARRSWRIAAGGLLVAASVSALLLLPGGGAERMPSGLSGAVASSLDAMGWLSLNSTQGVVAMVDLLSEWKVARTLVSVGGTLLGAATTTATDPLFALCVTAMMMVGLGSAFMMARLMRPKLNGASVHGRQYPMGG